MITNVTKQDELSATMDMIRPPFVYFEQTRIQSVYHFYLNGEILEAILYVDMIHRIRTAAPGDIVYIHLNTVGGNLSAGIQIVNAMEASEAHVICILEGEAHSLGTLIFLSADEFIVHDNCMMMFHNYSGGIVGKGHEQRQQLQATDEWFTKLARAKYIPFLSEEEFETMLEGKDIWILSEDIRARLLTMVAHESESNPKKEPLMD